MPRPPSKTAPLNIRHKSFCRHYARNQNATQAYYDVYGPDITMESATSGGLRLLADPRVIEEIGRRLEDKETRLEISADRVLLEVVRLALFDPRKLLDDNGKMKEIQDLDSDTAACIAQLEFHALTGKLKRIKVWDKNAALDKLGKYFKLFTERTEITGKDGGPLSVEGKVSAMKAILAEIEAQPHGLGVPGDNGGALGVEADDSQDDDGEGD